ncbi:MAG TPA: zinc-ribbon domain-containing protein [Bryobacteraceae bacterium]|nr:zinc-ribbon domain-containing protein [Bryobacteraceae bacterium]
MFCHRCGSQVSADVQFCPNCGEPLGAPSPASVPVPWTPPANVQVRSGHWIGQGWELVKADMGTYVLLALVFCLLSSAVPVILQGPLIAGMHIFTIKKLVGRRAEFADLFVGFNYFIPTLVASLVIGLFVSIGTLLCIIPGLVVAAMYKFTYLFIVDKGMDFWPAMQASHEIVKRDYVGFTLFLLLLILVDVLGVLCCVVGIFVALPVTFAAITVAYRELVGFEPRTVETL